MAIIHLMQKRAAAKDKTEAETEIDAYLFDNGWTNDGEPPNVWRHAEKGLSNYSRDGATLYQHRHEQRQKAAT